ncbi:MAG: EthD family reductase [Solirubrobacteraceae bacterium]
MDAFFVSIVALTGGAAVFGTSNLVMAMVGMLATSESAKVFPKEDGSPTPAYRTIDIYFSDYATACAALESPEAGELAGGLAQAATGGIRFLLSDIED